MQVNIVQAGTAIKYAIVDDKAFKVQKLTICTPYFNLQAILVRNIIQLLREGKKVEIIVGDKTANDFYIPEDEPFKIIGVQMVSFCSAQGIRWKMVLFNRLDFPSPTSGVTES